MYLYYLLSLIYAVLSIKFLSCFIFITKKPACEKAGFSNEAT